jgi:hypothetical protein
VVVVASVDEVVPSGAAVDDCVPPEESHAVAMSANAMTTASSIRSLRGWVVFSTPGRVTPRPNKRRHLSHADAAWAEGTGG